ncbi:VOC family protein [Streptomyces antimicrobicus]|uniref:VOC family protein n=1 Tax=Streptomyces antimicrobicus TaxID=2883108 RepID=A0ABS8B8S4_9ACTN|nr:VOC family protein [Streptomyces antimicrobicus]MCB5181016.1 VOC family protein [Streptomyces antimicrobicus]
MIKGFTTCLWFDGKAEEAAEFYVSVFKDGSIGRIVRCTEAGPGPVGSVLVVEFEANGQRFAALNGGPEFTFTEAVSFQVHCADQAEADHYWEALTADGGEGVACGWVKDKFGLSWQVFPAEVLELVADPDPQRAARATRAMLTMQKLDVEQMRRAADGT